MTTILIWLVEILAFFFVLGGTVAGARWLEGYVLVRRRLQGDPAQSSETSSSLIKRDTVQNPTLRWIESVSSLSDASDRTKLRRELALAGINHPAAPVAYVILRFACAVGLPFAYITLQYFAAAPAKGLMLVMCTLFLGAVGMIAPRAILDNRIGARKSQISNEFPDALDLMVICVEAGLGLEAAIHRVSGEIKASHPMIAAEFSRFTQEMQAGRGRADALRTMADRVDVAPIRAFVGLMIQSDSLGASIGQTLRTYSTEMRERRFFIAEEKAMRVPVLMTIPLIACILPVIIATVMLPAIIDIVRVGIPSLTGTR